MARHPKHDELSAWLEGDAPHLDDHLEVCDRCARVIEGFDDPESDLRSALVSLLTPPSDLEARITERIAERVQARRDTELFAALLGIPLEAGRIVLESPDS